MYSKRVSLAQCAEFIVDNRGRTCPVGEVGLPLIATNCLSSGDLYPRMDTTRFVSEHVYSTWFRAHPLPGDIIFVTKGAPGRVCLAPNPVDFCIAQDMVAIRANKKLVDPKFLFAALRSPATLNAINDLHVGTMIPHFKKGDFDKLFFDLPELHVQERIGRLHYELCERIENLRQMNATLEGIAQALFKSWFVDFDPVRAKAEGRDPEGMDAATAALFPSEFEDSELGPIPKGWRVDGLGEVSQNIREQAKPHDLHPSTPYIGLEHMPRESIALLEQGTAEGLASGKFWYRTNDILFGKLRPYFHKVGVAVCDGVCSTDILVVRPVSLEWFAYTTMQFSSKAVVAHATQLSNGAKMPRTNWSDLAKYRVVLPSEGAAEAFDRIVRPIISRIQANIAAIRTLSQLRDTMLPRLISGKLRLPETEAILEETHV